MILLLNSYFFFPTIEKESWKDNEILKERNKTPPNQLKYLSKSQLTKLI